MIVLTVNTGSSSVRLAVHVWKRGHAVRTERAARLTSTPANARADLQSFLRQRDMKPQVVAHRVVHGGDNFVQPTLITSRVETEIERLIPLAPLHNSVALSWIRIAREICGKAVPHVAVFDTAFHAALPEAARRYAIPAAMAAQYGLRRYGFHGIAHEAMWRRWCRLRPDLRDGGRVISFQLGSGCSVSAMDGGRPLDTSMGFTPTEGLMMATRCGDVDPGLITYLQRHAHLDPEATEDLLNRQSGLLGVAGEADMSRLLGRDDADARLAAEMYCRRGRKYLGAYLALLEGADGVLFGGGVGENAPPVRARILAGMRWAGIDFDAAANETVRGTDACITSLTSDIQAWVLPVDEAALLAEAAVGAIGEDCNG